MSSFGYDLAFGVESPFEGDEGSSLAISEAMKKHILSAYYTPDMELQYDLEKIASQCETQRELEKNLFVYFFKNALDKYKERTI